MISWYPVYSNEEVDFLLAAHCRIDSGTDHEGELDCGETYSTAATVNQNRLNDHISTFIDFRVSLLT